MALALLEDETLKHPRLEVIITVSEEVGMEGAAGIDVSMIKGRKLLNLDSEEEGHFLAGCAGGCRMELEYPAKKEQVEKEITEKYLTQFPQYKNSFKVYFCKSDDGARFV